jgi:hypothetical protein
MSSTFAAPLLVTAIMAIANSILMLWLPIQCSLLFATIITILIILAIFTKWNKEIKQ